MNQRFNLVEEAWIPVVNRGRVSLKEVFQDSSLKELSGNPVQKLALLKLLLAIAQRAYTPKDNEDWGRMKARGLGERCLEYLEKHKELFWMYGDKPFLQMPILGKMQDNNNKDLVPSNLGRDYCPDLPSENDTIVLQSQLPRDLADAERAVFLVTLMNYSLGGKRAQKDIEPLSIGYVGKGNTAKSSPSLGNYIGYLNSCLWGQDIIETIWLNLFTYEQLALFPAWANMEIVPPWERMPSGEDDENARAIKNGFIGTLVSMSRFVLLQKDGLFYADGIQYPSHTKGWREPFISNTPEGKMLWLDTSKKPWRNLIAFLNTSFHGGASTYDCPQISLLLGRARPYVEAIGIFSGGLQVRANAGDQSVKQTDDYIESLVFIPTKIMGESWFLSLKHEMEELEGLSKIVWSSVHNYFKGQGKDPGKGKEDPSTDKAVEMFWQLCERRFQRLVEVCEDDEAVYPLRKDFASYVQEAYERYCSNESAKQMSAWAKNRPNLGRYLARQKEEVDFVKSKK